MASIEVDLDFPPNSHFPVLAKVAKGKAAPENVLVELDRALRYGNIGEICEAIVYFGRVIRRYPWPMIVNSVVLKLAELFRSTVNNTVRFHIFLVFRRSEAQLCTIYNVDQVLKSLYNVLQSNDPIARSITLRTLGSMPSLVKDALMIHHGIRNCFESHHTLEVKASLFAMTSISAHSPVFANGIIDKLAHMIEALTTDIDTKLQLIRIFGSLHHDSEMVAKARKTCSRLLKSYPSQEFVVTILETLTVLAQHSLVDVNKQKKLLEDYASNDPRSAVKAAALSLLGRLVPYFSQSTYSSVPFGLSGAESSHSDTPKGSSGIEELVFMLNTTAAPRVQRAILVLMRAVTRPECVGGASSVSTGHNARQHFETVWEKAKEAVAPLLHSERHSLCSLAAEVLANVAVINATVSRAGGSTRDMDASAATRGAKLCTLAGMLCSVLVLDAGAARDEMGESSTAALSAAGSYDRSKSTQALVRKRKRLLVCLMELCACESGSRRSPVGVVDSVAKELVWLLSFLQKCKLETLRDKQTFKVKDNADSLFMLHVARTLLQLASRQPEALIPHVSSLSQFLIALARSNNDRNNYGSNSAARIHDKVEAGGDEAQQRMAMMIADTYGSIAGIAENSTGGGQQTTQSDSFASTNDAGESEAAAPFSSGTSVDERTKRSSNDDKLLRIVSRTLFTVCLRRRMAAKETRNYVPNSAEGEEEGPSKMETVDEEEASATPLAVLDVAFALLPQLRTCSKETGKVGKGKEKEEKKEQRKGEESSSWRWGAFVFAKEAFCFSFHEVAFAIFRELTDCVESETFYWWFAMLQHVCDAEAKLQEHMEQASGTHHRTDGLHGRGQDSDSVTLYQEENDSVQGEEGKEAEQGGERYCARATASALSAAVSALRRAQVQLKAARTSRSSFAFPQRALDLRVEFLETCSSAYQLVDLLPETTGGNADSTLEEGRAATESGKALESANSHRQARVTGLRAHELALRMQQVSQRYTQLAQSCFDMDSAGRTLLEANRIACSLAALSLDTLLCKHDSADQVAFGIKRIAPDPLLLRMESSSAARMTSEVGKAQEREQGPTETEVHRKCASVVEALSAFVVLKAQDESAVTTEVTKELARDFLDQLVALPALYPEHFFLSRPLLSLELTVSPQPKRKSEAQCVKQDVGLVLNVSGILTLHAQRHKMDRDIRSIQLDIEYYEAGDNPSGNWPMGTRAPKRCIAGERTREPLFSISQHAEPLDGSFTASALIRFEERGMYDVVVTASILDVRNELFTAGDPTHLRVRVD